MEFNVLERLLILNLDTLPKVGTIITLKIKNKMMEAIGFSEKEIEEFEIKADAEKVSFNSAAAPVDIEIGPEAIKMLVDAIEKAENLHEGYIPLYDRLTEVK